MEQHRVGLLFERWQRSANRIRGFTAIYSTYYAFAALTADGSISAWGGSDYGGSGAPTGSGFTLFDWNSYDVHTRERMS